MISWWHECPSNAKTHQPLGLLHGGASVALAETLGSVAATLCVDETKFCVGLEINANHVKGVRNGFVKEQLSPSILESKLTSGKYAFQTI